MAYRIVHKNSQGCVINEDESDIACERFDDETDAGDMLVKYVRATDVYPGDTLTVAEC